MYDSVLVPLDGSTFAEHAIATAVHLATSCHARLVLVRVHHLYPHDHFHTDTWDELFHSEEEAYLERVAAWIQPDVPGLVETAVLHGDIVEAICERARQCPSPIIVMSTHGRTGVKRAWLGSVADGVLRHSPAPVLMVRPPAMAREARRSPDAAYAVP
jgi:nucleotide-binding universal stress UspA family protein